MRLILAALLFPLLATQGPGLRAALPSVRVLNRDYVRIDDWARQHQLTVQRSSASREILAQGPHTRVLFLLNASRITVNNVAVWLSNPVLSSGGQPVVAAQDVQTVLDPLVRPPQLPAGRRIRTICLDPGHGGKEPGQKSGNRLEKTFTLSLAEQLRTRLVRAGFNVVMTRRSDTYVDFPDRTAIAKRHNADLFISLHFNATANRSSDAGGFEVYAMTPAGARSTNDSADPGYIRAATGNETDAENILLAFQLQKSLLGRLPKSTDRGVRRARFLVLRLAEMPAVLVEAGFMSNPSDARLIFSQAGREKIAQALLDGVLAYRRAVERPAAITQRGTTSKSSTTKAPGASAKN